MTMKAHCRWKTFSLIPRENFEISVAPTKQTWMENPGNLSFDNVSGWSNKYQGFLRTSQSGESGFVKNRVIICLAPVHLHTGFQILTGDIPTKYFKKFWSVLFFLLFALLKSCCSLLQFLLSKYVSSNIYELNLYLIHNELINQYPSSNITPYTLFVSKIKIKNPFILYLFIFNRKI